MRVHDLRVTASWTWYPAKKRIVQGHRMRVDTTTSEQDDAHDLTPHFHDPRFVQRNSVADLYIF